MNGFAEKQSFSTRHVSAQRSLGVWREYMREVYFKLDIEAAKDTPVLGHLIKRNFAQACASAFRSDEQRVIRSEQLVSEDSIECFCLVFPTMGGFAFRQRGRSGEARAGGGYILNAHEPYEVDIAQGSQMVCLTLPGDLLRERIKTVDDLCGTSSFADATMASTMRRLIGVALESTPRVDACRLQDLFLGIAEMMSPLGLQGDAQMPADILTSCILERADDAIEARLSDPSFTVTRAATACGVSVRRLQAAYQSRGTTFATEILKARLLRARLILQSKTKPPGWIGLVATRCGFVSQSHFSTSYRLLFGHSPRDEPAASDY